MSKCKLCDQGHEPKINGSSVEHWIVKSIFPARITIKTCKEPEAAIRAEKAEAIIEAQSKALAEARVVKPLEWFTELDHLAVAISPVGVWRVWNNLVLETPAPPTTKRYDSLAEAKAAAQADYEQRASSAPSPQPRRTPMSDQTNAEVSDERLRERADALWEQLLPHMQVAAHASGAHSAYDDKVAAIGFIMAELTRRSITSQASEGEIARLREELNREQLAHDKTKCELRDAYDILATEASP